MDLFQNPTDMLTIEPPEVGKLFTAVMKTELSKRLASQYKKPWSQEQETRLHEEVAALVATCRERRLTSIRVTATHKNGNKTVMDLNVDKINKTRSLQ